MKIGVCANVCVLMHLSVDVCAHVHLCLCECQCVGSRSVLSCVFLYSVYDLRFLLIMRYAAKYKQFLEGKKCS